jgi:hypothetical protein
LVDPKIICRVPTRIPCPVDVLPFERVGDVVIRGVVRDVEVGDLEAFLTLANGQWIVWVRLDDRSVQDDGPVSGGPVGLNRERVGRPVSGYRFEKLRVVMAVQIVIEE